ncbi:MAG: UvrD-helicase domain-containing protein [Firmicutes bacterium]|nr:UvrD-helicase domain-containing protein [Bacillota bacterium]
MAKTAFELLHELIQLWRKWETNETYYLNTLAPAIMRGDDSFDLKDREKEIIAQLRELLSPEEWSHLPQLIAQCRTGTLNSLPSDEQRKQASPTKAQQRVRQLLANHGKQQHQERLKRRQEQTTRERQRRMQKEFQTILQRDFLGADQAFAAQADNSLLTPDDYVLLKTAFVQEWVRNNTKKPLDQDQAAAVAAATGDIQVTARAGSGKTRTLVARTIFLQKHCSISPDQILLLAFNKNAAQHMLSELESESLDNLPHVMTFHALAYALIHPGESLIFDDASTDQLGLSREVQEVIDEHIRSNDYSNRIRDLMLAHFRHDWEQIVNGRFQLARDEFLAYRRSLPRESLGGDFVKSFGEKVIANALFEHGVDYRYEANVRWNGLNYRPDFMIRTERHGGIIIEYFGLQDDPDYDEMSQQKRGFWASRPTWKLLEFTPDDLIANGEEGFVELLIQKLKEEDIRCKRLSEDEIWEKLRARDPDFFSAAMKTFIERCRKLNWSPEDLERYTAIHTPWSLSEQEFVMIGAAVYRAYLDRLASHNRQDFDGLMWEAVSRVCAGQTRFIRQRGKEQGDLAKLKFVMIDEFQDFTPAFAAMAAAIRQVNPKVNFFCVGDDWQAINGFAGSDLKFFRDFDQYFENTSRLYIPTNYRSDKSIVRTGNALMYGKGTEAKAHSKNQGRVQVYHLDEIQLLPREEDIHDGDEITPAVLRLIKHFLDWGHDVVLLSRRNSVPWYVNYRNPMSRRLRTIECFLNHIRLFMPKEDCKRVTISTVHKYKGKECSAVILLDAVQSSYPLMHPNWVFYRIFGDTLSHIEAEERRLFYVGLTRAEHHLAIITESGRESPYLHDINQRFQLAKADWDELPPMPSLDGEYLVISAWVAYEVRDSLKQQGYIWNAADRCWQKSVPRNGFSLEVFSCTQPWIEWARKVEIRAETGELLATIP